MSQEPHFDRNSPLFIEHKRFFKDFLDEEKIREGKYLIRVQEMLQGKKTRLMLSLDDLRAKDKDMANLFLKKPIEYFAAWQDALKDFAEELMDDDRNKDDVRYTLGIEGSFGGNRLTPRQLNTRHLGQLVCIEGIATRCSRVRPKVVKTVHYCDATGKYTTQSFFDSTSITGSPTPSVYPTQDENNNPLTTEYGFSQYVDSQSMAIQEMPEKAPAGLLPMSVDVVLEGAVCDACKPGDRVRVAGIYRPLATAANGEASGMIRAVLIANSVRPLIKEAEESEITEEDNRQIYSIAKRKDRWNLLWQSIAPSIHGCAEIKQAILLLLLGGCEKNLENGTHIRGDINILMVGDPSTAKSQLLRFVLNVAPLAVNTTGRGSSGVGLTAAVLSDKDTGEKRLEAGAMVLADRGIVCIDEFDKMSDNDRVAIHEVMEQQTVTIAKAGIHMSLNARCSVIAAANPVYGNYNTSKKPHENIGLQDSLLSRFDLLFILLDIPDATTDRAIATKVLNNHKFLRKHGADDDDDPDDKPVGEETPVFEKYDRFLHGSDRSSSSSSSSSSRAGGAPSFLDRPKSDILSIPFLKKYIKYAKERPPPKLSDEAVAYVSSAYSKLRARENAGMPITARALETMIRLSSAHAKSRLKRTVEVEDCEVANNLMLYALDHESRYNAMKNGESEQEGKGDDDDNDDDDDDDNGSGERKRRKNNNNDENGDKQSKKKNKKKSKQSKRDENGDEMDDDNDDNDDDTQTSPRSKKRSSSRKGRNDDDEDMDENEGEHNDENDDDDEDDTSSRHSKKSKRSSSSSSSSSSLRLSLFKSKLSMLGEQLARQEMSCCSLDELIEFVNNSIENSQIKDKFFSHDEADKFLKVMDTDNAVMYKDDTINFLN
jgi:DNA replication licensing factor MCM3